MLFYIILFEIAFIPINLSFLLIISSKLESIVHVIKTLVLTQNILYKHIYYIYIIIIHSPFSNDIFISL